MSSVVTIRYRRGRDRWVIGFDKQEAALLVIKKIHGFVLKRLQNRKPFIRHISRPYKKFELTVKICSRETLAKLALLRGVTLLMELEIPDGNGGTETIDIRLISDIPEYFCAGHLAAEKEIVLEFVETE